MRFSPAQDTWQSLAPRPVAAYGANAAVLGEKIYVPGGLSADGKPLDRLDIYDPRLDRWESGAPLPAPLAGAALAAFEGRLYLFGGTDGIQDHAEVYAYDPIQDAWSQAATLPGPRSYAAAAALEGKVLVFGGLREQAALDQALVFYPARAGDNASAWEQRGPMPYTRGKTYAAVLAGTVYLEGPPMVQYDPQEDAWISLTSSPVPPGGRVVVPLDTRIHVISGIHHWSYQAIYTLLVPLQ